MTIRRNTQLPKPTLEEGAALDAVLCWPATTPAEYRLLWMIDKSEDSILYMDYKGKKGSLLESLSDIELRQMIKEKKANIDFNCRIEWFHNIYYKDDPRFYLANHLNEVHIEMLNAPLIHCIDVFNRELRNRSDKQKAAKIDIDALKNSVSILSVFESYGVIGRYRPGSLIKCPLPSHDDGSASCMLYTKNNTWHCFGCHAGGSQIDLIMKMEGVSVRDAIKKLSNF